VNSFKTPILKVTVLLALAFLLALGCADKPKDPNANIEPNTFISSYNIDITPDSATFYWTTVYWRGSDADGEPVVYCFWLDPAVKDTTNETSARVRLQYDEANPSHTFYVICRDNLNGWDATPAAVELTLNDVRHGDQFNPQTEAITVPPDGAATSQAVSFTVSSLSLGGIITRFEYAVDDPTTWTAKTPDIISGNTATAAILLGPAELSLGTHVVYIRGVDNMGNVDQSPVTVSIDCLDTFTPELVVSVADGQSYIVPFTDPTIPNFTVTFVATVDFYYGVVDSFVVMTSRMDTLRTMTPELNLGDLAADSYWVQVSVYDHAGNSTVSDTVHFSIVELPAGDGVLCVNGVDWLTYGAQNIAQWSIGTPWGNRTHYKTWDLFDTTPVDDVPLMADSLLGIGSIPAWMFDTTFFNAIVWMGNEYGGDEVYWNERQTEIMAYLAMGGNIILPTRYARDFFFTDLATYCGIIDADWIPGASPTALTAQVDSLTAISSIGSHSLSDIPMTDNPNNVWIYEADVAPGAHDGFITLPNGPGGGGGFCFIAGRNYRWNHDELKANFDVILRYYFGIM